MNSFVKKLYLKVIKNQLNGLATRARAKINFHGFFLSLIRIDFTKFFETFCLEVEDFARNDNYKILQNNYGPVFKRKRVVEEAFG